MASVPASSHEGVVYLGLGSNLGDRDANLRAALAALAPDVRVIRLSSVYDTEPLHYVRQPRFHNMVSQATTALSPVELLHYLKKIEVSLGRVAGERYGPRVIDLDILFYDQLVVTEPDLIIPHPRLAERAFVLAPLAEIAPNLRHPILQASIKDLSQSVAGSDVRKLGVLSEPTA